MRKMHGNLGGSTLERQQSWKKNRMRHKIHLFVLLELMEAKSLNQPKPLFLAKKKVWDSVGSIKKNQWSWRRTLMYLRTDFYLFILF